MQFHSLADPSHTATIQQAIVNGVPPIEGHPNGAPRLYVPSQIPRLSEREIAAMRGMEPIEIAFRVLWAWLRDEMPEDDLRAIVQQAYTFPVPIRQVGGKYILELFHGDTAAFKDFAARFLAAFMSYYAKLLGRVFVILVATSGDTFGAIAKAFANMPGTMVVGLWPKGLVSLLQEEQLTRTADNVTSLEIDGTFDDCQDLVIRALSDQGFAGMSLTSANSISVGRLLPQSIYYALASLALTSSSAQPVRFVVPSGNLGNLTAGVLAWHMGFPIDRFLAANNQNNLFYRYVTTGDNQERAHVRTFSNAMDVRRPNNLVRLDHIFAGSRAQLMRLVSAETVSEELTVQTIQRVFRDQRYMLDPHTAVAWAASALRPKPGYNDVVVSTAAPAKFAEEILQRCGIRVDNSEMLALLRETPRRYQSLPNDYGAFADVLAHILKTGV